MVILTFYVASEEAMRCQKLDRIYWPLSIIPFLSPALFDKSFGCHLYQFKPVFMGNPAGIANKDFFINIDFFLSIFPTIISSYFNLYIYRIWIGFYGIKLSF